MGFFSFIKKIFAGEGVDEEALEAARARHGIKIDEKTKKEANKATAEEERFAENFDAWDELRNLRMNFFFGSWVTRKFRPIGEDKLKKRLAELEKKRQAEAEKKKGED